LELAAVNPVAVLGPVLGPDFSASIALVQAMLDGRAPAAPKISFGLVDVRDVADLHLRAMESPAANGQRFLAVAGEPVRMVEIGRMLRERLGEAGRRAPRLELPDWATRALALAVPRLREVLPMLGPQRRASGGKARRLLGWMPRSNEDIVMATAESLLALKLVRP
jgi:dihydroflavonol-4-reductase